MPDPKQVLIFDTTLRDGEQSPGISLNTHREARDRPPARAARRRHHRGRLPDRLAGRLRGRAGDRAGGRRPDHRGLARANAADIEAAWNAVKDAARPRIHTFIATSDIHIEHQLQKTREDVKGLARAAVAQARGLLRGRRVLARGRHARRRRVHRRGLPDRDRRGRDDDQHPRHRRLHDARGVRRYLRAAHEHVAGPDATSSSRRTATTTSGSRSPTRSPACWPARARSSARSTASASAPATPRSRRS